MSSASTDDRAGSVNQQKSLKVSKNKYDSFALSLFAFDNTNTKLSKLYAQDIYMQKVRYINNVNFLSYLNLYYPIQCMTKLES